MNFEDILAKLCGRVGFSYKFLQADCSDGRKGVKVRVFGKCGGENENDVFSFVSLAYPDNASACKSALSYFTLAPDSKASISSCITKMPNAQSIEELALKLAIFG